jgi:FkbM family methyltransferase
MKKVLKRVYELAPFKKQIFLILRHLKLSQSIYMHLHFKEWIKVMVDQSSFKIYHYGYQVENDLFWSGVRGNWERQSLDLWIRLCKKSKVILDIGANTGVYSLIAGAIKETAKIYAFEPSKAVAAKLQKNIDANQFDIELCPVAISNKNGHANFYDKVEHNYTGSLNSNHGSNTLAYEVNTQTLDDFIEKNGLRVDLIKIDVEKHEPEVIEGFQKYIRIQQPTILIEILDENVAKKIQSLIHGIPYLYFNLNENGSVRRVEMLTKSDDFNYLLCREDVAQEIGLLPGV